MIIRIDTSGFAAARSKIEAAKSAALKQAAEHLLEEANRTVPLEEGTLMGTGHVSVDGDTAQVGYGTPYARVQHERTWYRHAPGRRAKWLQLTFQERAGDVGRWVQAEIRRRVR